MKKDKEDVAQPFMLWHTKDKHTEFLEECKNLTNPKVRRIFQFFEDESFNSIFNGFLYNIGACSGLLIIFLFVWSPGSREIRLITPLENTVQKQRVCKLRKKQRPHETMKKDQTDVILGIPKHNLDEGSAIPELDSDQFMMGDSDQDVSYNSINNITSNSSDIEDSEEDSQFYGDEDEWESSKKRLRYWLQLDKGFLTASCTESAMAYIILQRYLIVLQFFTCILAIFIILPINGSAGTRFKPYSFQATTTDNIDENSHVFWVHLLSSTSIVIMALFYVKKFSMKTRQSKKRSESEGFPFYLFSYSIMNALEKKVQFHFFLFLKIHQKKTHRMEVEAMKTHNRTLFITGLPMILQEKHQLELHLKLFYPGIVIENIHVNIGFPFFSSLRQVALEFRILKSIVKQYGQYCQNPKVYDRKECCCGFVRFNYCLYHGLDVDGRDYYEALLRDHIKIMKKKRQEILSKKVVLDSAFVEFESQSMAEEVFTLGNHRLGDMDYSIERAPDLDSVHWSRLGGGTYQIVKVSCSSSCCCAHFHHFQCHFQCPSPSSRKYQCFPEIDWRNNNYFMHTAMTDHVRQDGVDRLLQSDCARFWRVIRVLGRGDRRCRPKQCEREFDDNNVWELSIHEDNMDLLLHLLLPLRSVLPMAGQLLEW